MRPFPLPCLMGLRQGNGTGNNKKPEVHNKYYYGKITHSTCDKKTIS